MTIHSGFSTANGTPARGVGVEFAPSDEQVFFQETTRKFLSAECPIPVVRSLESAPAGYDAPYWRQGAELGWTSLLVPAEAGGGSLSGEGLMDLVLVAEEMGRMVSPGPLAPVNVVASAVAAGGSAAQQAAVLPGLLSGETVAAWCGERPVEGVIEGENLVLSGRVSPVEAGAQAQHLLVAARTPRGLMQVLVPGAAPRVTVTPLGGLDLVRRFAEVHFDGVVTTPAERIGVAGDAAAAVEHQLQIACVLQCAETVGAMSRVFEMTLEYLSDRYSFGRPLASYQALKHRMADNKMWLESSHAVMTAAAGAVAGGSPAAGEIVSAAKAWIGPHATELIQDCVQLHGGIGVTWEHDLHLYLRRTTVNRVTHGTPEYHAERIATQLLGTAS